MTVQEETGEYSSAAESIDNQNTAQEALSSEPSDQGNNRQELNFKRFREEIDYVKRDRDELRQQLELLRRNQAPQEQKRLVPEKDEDDYVSIREFEQVLEQREKNYAERLTELQFAQSHPDYNEVLEKYTKPLINEKPHLWEGINSASNKALYAYELGMMAKSLKEQQDHNPQVQKAKAMVANSRKPQTLSGAGGSTPLTNVTDYANMPTDDFMKLYQRNRGMSY
jgi:hypothetical protein